MNTVVLNAGRDPLPPPLGESEEPEAGGGLNMSRETAWLVGTKAGRSLTRLAYVMHGRLRRQKTRGWWPFAWLLATVLAVLALAPIVLDLIVGLLDKLGIKDRFGVDRAPEVADWLTLPNVALLFLGAVVLRWLSLARERVVVEGFIDHTIEDAKAVSGLSTLLVTELGRLRDLYRQVTEASVPTAVGVERQGGFGRAKEAAAFLTVSAEGVTDELKGAIASDARLELGPARIPIGPMLALLNRLARGPRVVGSVHLTEAGGGPTLTAQLVGGQVTGTWRVDHTGQPESPAQRKAFLDTMVRELACRMFARLTLGGSVRWQAVQAFNEYLRLYGSSRCTPRDRARFLKEAQAKLLEAVAEDETFDLAFYNLGVIHTQLAQAELAAHMAPGDWQDPAELQEALKMIGSARENATAVDDDRVRERCLVSCLESQTRVLCALGDYEDALKLTKEWLRLRPAPDGFMREAELLDLLTLVDGRPDHRQLRIAAEMAWGGLEWADAGRSGSPRASDVRARLQRALRNTDGRSSE